MKEFWDERFKQTEYIYGQEPNTFLKSQLVKFTKGKILFPLEGEGRNACFAASLGFIVDAFDFSEAGKHKALELATRKNLAINYSISKAEDYDFGTEIYDYIVLIYAHLNPSIRPKIHQKIVNALKPNGRVIIEAFHPKQLKNNYTSGGPKSLDMLYTTKLLKNDFSDLNILLAEEIETELNEGNYHKGKAFVSRFIGQK
ncbi:class I SAM-dependent methyltransferase [Psychroflexus sp. ALD_RP9]|uniref:class I SAM-dependent methyltransferase n=1 Tax=Psychroflexus sp. ALD_RP9 TaxID=2777186 RepID=UPI001A8E8F04|nr:class I SAM-dependent methyltransferase [Psychroflexus sp. ALD_RP9]QSS97206.1 class I SAM-dependent methyltransferase [Psychroflexus sp. ALD_RP9]